MLAPTAFCTISPVLKNAKFENFFTQPKDKKNTS